MKKILLLLLCICGTIYCQTFNISGTVTDKNGKPLRGVNIIVDGTPRGTASAEDGSYFISGFTPGKYSLTFSHLGFKEEIREVTISGAALILNIVLEEQVVETERIIITAGKYEQNISELPVSAEILPGEEVVSKNISNLKGAMKYIPGINMTDDQVSIRGSSGYSRGAGTRVLLAIDGIPFYTGDTGEIIWEIIPVTQIERIEVIKGSASALYGSTAIGGVINIITKSYSDQPQTYFRGIVGSYGKPSYDEWDWSGRYRFFNGLTLTHSDKVDDFSFTASITRLEDEGYRQSGFFHRYLGYFKGRYNFSPTSSFDFIFNSINQRNGNFIYWKNSRNALVPPDADQGQRVESNRYMFAGIYRNVVKDNFFLDAKLSYYRTFWEDQTISANSSKGNLFRGELQGTYLLNSSVVIVSGLEGLYSEIKSNIFSNRKSAGVGLYAQTDVTFPFPLVLNIGARFDFNQLDTVNSFSNFSPKFGFNYRLMDNLTFRGSFGTGFRAPSLAEAFTTTTVSLLTVVPNFDIQPETSISFEAGINYQPLKWFNFDAAVFNNDYYNFIEPEFKSADRIFFDNITRANIKGFEVNTKFEILSGLNLSLGYTYLWARDLQLNKALKFRPRHIGSAGVQYNFLNFETGADFSAWSKVEEIDPILELVIPDGHVRDDVFVLDLHCGYNFSSLGLPLKLNLSGHNILNYNYVELTGNLAPIRNISLSAELLF